MHTDMADRILLDASGELSRRDQRRLHRHLAVCVTCRQYRQDVDRIEAAVAHALPMGTPLPSSLVAIKAEARRLLALQPESRLRWRWHTRFAVAACAAAFLVLLGMWQARNDRRRVHNIEHVDALVELLDPTPSGTDNGFTGGNQEEALRALAHRLLRLQGLSGGSAFDEVDI